MSLNTNDGKTLVEMLIAASMGASLLLVSLTLLHHFNTSAGRLSTKMMLYQELSVVTRRLVSDLTRAGSNNSQYALVPKGSELPVYITDAGDKLQYSYWDDRDGGDADSVKNYVWHYQVRQHKLSVCYLTSSRIAGPKAVGFDTGMGCTSVFEADRVSVTHFGVQSKVFNQDGVNRQFLQLEVELQLRKDPDVTQSITRHIWVRNGFK